MSDHLTLIDGSGFIHRAYHALPPLERADGQPIGAVFGFTSMLVTFLEQHAGSHIAVVFDHGGAATHRHTMYPQYKANRRPREDGLTTQFPLVRDCVSAFGIPAIEAVSWEADDLIATYALAADRRGWHTTIVSSDKDLMQLVGGDIGMWDPIRKAPITRETILAKFGVPPERLHDYLALTGDASDNIPGIPGIGPMWAKRLINQYGSFSEVLTAGPWLADGKVRTRLLDNMTIADLSYRLVQLRTDVPMAISLDDLRACDPDPALLRAWLLSQGFNAIVAKLGL